MLLPPALAGLPPDKEKARLAPGSWSFGVLQDDENGDRQDHDARDEDTGKRFHVVLRFEGGRPVGLPGLLLGDNLQLVFADQAVCDSKPALALNPDLNYSPLAVDLAAHEHGFKALHGVSPVRGGQARRPARFALELEHRTFRGRGALDLGLSDCELAEAVSEREFGTLVERTLVARRRRERGLESLAGLSRRVLRRLKLCVLFRNRLRHGSNVNRDPSEFLGSHGMSYSVFKQRGGIAPLG